MALIVKSSIDILPWTEIEKQKLIEEKEEFLSKKAEESKVEIENKEEIKEEIKEEVKNSDEVEKSKETKTLKSDKKKEVKK